MSRYVCLICWRNRTDINNHSKTYLGDILDIVHSQENIGRSTSVTRKNILFKNTHDLKTRIYIVLLSNNALVVAETTNQSRNINRSSSFSSTLSIYLGPFWVNIDGPVGHGIDRKPNKMNRKPRRQNRKPKR